MVKAFAYRTAKVVAFVVALPAIAIALGWWVLDAWLDQRASRKPGERRKT